jgi:hypothetical protein
MHAAMNQWPKTDEKENPWAAESTVFDSSSEKEIRLD